MAQPPMIPMAMLRIVRTERDHRGDGSSEDEVRSRIDAHDLQRVDLFGNAHRADLRSDARTDLAGQNQRHDRRREFEDHRLARGVTDQRTGDERRIEVDAHLQGDDRTDEDRNNGRQADRVDSQGLHFVNDAPAVDGSLLRTEKTFPISMK